MSEYTAAEEGGEGHCVRAGNLLFDDNPTTAQNTRSPIRTYWPSPSSSVAVYSDVRALISNAHMVARYTALLSMSGYLQLLASHLLASGSAGADMKRCHQTHWPRVLHQGQGGTGQDRTGQDRTGC